MARRAVQDGPGSLLQGRALAILEFRFWILDWRFVSFAGLVGIIARFRFWILSRRDRRVRRTATARVLDLGRRHLLR